VLRMFDLYFLASLIADWVRLDTNHLLVIPPAALAAEQ
jgi:hypothetical protein